MKVLSPLCKQSPQRTNYEIGRKWHHADIGSGGSRDAISCIADIGWDFFPARNQAVTLRDAIGVTSDIALNGQTGVRDPFRQ